MLHIFCRKKAGSFSWEEGVKLFLQRSQSCAPLNQMRITHLTSDRRGGPKGFSKKEGLQHRCTQVHLQSAIRQQIC